jgi:hypothetical protein
VQFSIANSDYKNNSPNTNKLCIISSFIYYSKKDFNYYKVSYMEGRLKTWRKIYITEQRMRKYVGIAK